MTRREKISLGIMALVVVWAATIFYDLSDPGRKYRADEFYCKEDYDCVTVYDTLNTRCFAVNATNRDKHDTDGSCNKRIIKCVTSKCVLP